MFFTTSETEGEVVHVKLVPFQGGSFVVVVHCLFLVLNFALRVFMLFLVRFRLLSGHLLGGDCSLG